MTIRQDDDVLALLRQAVADRQPPPDPATGSVPPGDREDGEQHSPAHGREAPPPPASRASAVPRAGDRRRPGGSSVRAREERQASLFDRPTERGDDEPEAARPGTRPDGQHTPAAGGSVPAGRRKAPAATALPPKPGPAGVRTNAENASSPRRRTRKAGGKDRSTGRHEDSVAGHRARLRARFDRGETLADYELLELLLYQSLPRQDTKPIAKRLVAAFGSFAGAVSAPAERLREIEGIGDRVVSDFRLIRVAAERFALAEVAEREALSSTDAVVRYYRTKLRGVEREEFHVLYLDKKNGFLASERTQVGTVDHTPVYPREVLKRAIETGASALVLVHNHPSGDPTPSKADVSMTRKIVDAVSPVGITVHDHLVIGANGYASLRASGLM